MLKSLALPTMKADISG